MINIIKTKDTSSKSYLFLVLFPIVRYTIDIASNDVFPHRRKTTPVCYGKLYKWGLCIPLASVVGRLATIYPAFSV